jgi:putative membrane protein
MMGFGAYGGFGMLFGGLLWMALVVLVVWGAASLFPGRREGGQETVLQILQRRYAAGEITSAEYQQAKKDLS